MCFWSVYILFINVKMFTFYYFFLLFFLLPAGNRIITATKVIQEVIQECFDFKLWSYGPQMTASLLSLSHYSSLVLCTQMCTLGYEWAFVRLLNRPLCHVSRLIHLPWKKKPLISFSKYMEFNVFLCNADSPVVCCYRLFL